MLALLQQIVDETADTNEYLGDAPARQVRDAIAALPADASV